MKLDQLKTLFGEFDENVRFEQDLKKKNWFNIGGKTKVFFKANNLHELIKFLKIVNNQEKIFILGAGSNTLISDDLFDGIVIKSILFVSELYPPPNKPRVLEAHPAFAGSS